ncbi:MAG: AMP-binding protein [Polyangiaceae bacterium]
MMRTTRFIPGFVPWPEERAELYRRLGLWRGQTITEFFDEAVTKFPEHDAIVEGSRKVSYRELWRCVNGWSRALAEGGIEPLNRVVLQLPNGVDLLALFLALGRIGAIAVLALPGHRYLEICAFCDKARAVAVILPAPASIDWGQSATVEAVRKRCPAVRRIYLSRSDSWLHVGATPLFPKADDAALTPKHDACSSPSQVALLQLSGGSTGLPKLIARTHDDYLYSVRESVRICGLSEESRFLVVLPMMHNFTLSSPGVLGVLHVGGCVVINGNPLPSAVLCALDEQRITIVAAVPSLVRRWVEAASRESASCRFPNLLLQVGGARLDPGLADVAIGRLGCRLQQVFGMAEGLVNYTRLTDGAAVVRETQGRPLSSYDEIRVVDPGAPHGPPLPPGAVGELQTRGPYTIAGYFDEPEHNRRCFTEDGFYRTFDLVRRTEDGNLVVEGRMGERILRGGEKIDALELEQWLRTHPDVADVAVTGLADVELGERIAAFLVCRTGATVTLPGVRRFLRELGLAEFKLPDRLTLLDALPLTPVGKVDKRALVADSPARDL